jgi:MFS family permease
MSGEWRMALFLLGALVALFTFLFHTRRTTRRALRDDLLKLESERQRAVERLSEPPTSRYARALEWALRRLERFYGPAWSSRAFATSLLMAFCYAWAVFFILAGFGYGDGTVMGETLFQKVGNGYTQAVSGVAFGAGVPACLIAFGLVVAIFFAIAAAVVGVAVFTDPAAFTAAAAVGAGAAAAAVFTAAAAIAAAGVLKLSQERGLSMAYIIVPLAVFATEIAFGFLFTIPPSLQYPKILMCDDAEVV